MKNKLTAIAMILTAAMMGACNSMNATPPISLNDEQHVRAAAHAFAEAVKADDPAQLRQTTVVDAEAGSPELASAVVADTIAGRGIHMELAQRFGDAQQKAGAVGSNPWIEKMEASAASAPILQAGDRVRIGADDSSLYLRNVQGQWKVEVISTLVAESGGGAKVDDPAVEYRFKVARALNDYMRDRLAKGDFNTFEEYQRSRNGFWAKYLTYVANGEDPREKLLPTLPPMPKDDELSATER